MDYVAKNLWLATRQVAALAEIQKAKRRSRSFLVREAIDRYLESQVENSTPRLAKAPAPRPERATASDAVARAAAAVQSLKKE